MVRAGRMTVLVVAAASIDTVVANSTWTAALVVPAVGRTFLGAGHAATAKLRTQASSTAECGMTSAGRDASAFELRPSFRTCLRVSVSFTPLWYLVCSEGPTYLRMDIRWWRRECCRGSRARSTEDCRWDAVLPGPGYSSGISTSAGSSGAAGIEAPGGDVAAQYLKVSSTVVAARLVDLVVDGGDDGAAAAAA